MKTDRKPEWKSSRTVRFRPLMRLLEGVAWLGRRLMFWRQPGPQGLVLGQFVDGDVGGLPIGKDNEVVLPLTELARHVLVLGRAPQGKNLAALRLANEITRKNRMAQVFVFGDETDAELLTSTMAKTKRKSLCFPQEPFNTWVGSCHQVLNRLLRTLPFKQDGPARYQADRLEIILQLAFRLYGEPPWILPPGAVTLQELYEPLGL